jgi:hypothetical protein
LGGYFTSQEQTKQKQTQQQRGRRRGYEEEADPDGEEADLVHSTTACTTAPEEEDDHLAESQLRWPCCAASDRIHNGGMERKPIEAASPDTTRQHAAGLS